MSKIRVLQIGGQEYISQYQLPQNLDFQYTETITEETGKVEEKKKPYDLVLLCKEIDDAEVALLDPLTKSYTLFISENVTLRNDSFSLYRRKKGSRIMRSEIKNFLAKEARFFFGQSYGEKFLYDHLSISHFFSGDIHWNGRTSVELKGDFGTDWTQIACFTNTIPIKAYQVLSFWLEYEKEGTVEIRMNITKFYPGSIDGIENRWIFDEKAMEEIVHIDAEALEGNLHISFEAKGQGVLQIIRLHDRYSRMQYGHMVPGGKRYVCANREEVVSYFDLGDMKPPLNVFFAGFKTKEGFEGYHIMRSMKAPFLLFADERLTGGNFYLGTEEYEKEIIAEIRLRMKELGFGPKDVILSGISMGAFGALYYSSEISPGNVIVGKPLASVGEIARNTLFVRPDDFQTVLDVVYDQCGELSEEKTYELDRKFWDKFEKADFGRTKLAIAYMIEDDYESSAYGKILDHLHSDGVSVYGKGIHGRHNDNTGGIVNWFLARYQTVLETDYGRKGKK